MAEAERRGWAEGAGFRESEVAEAEERGREAGRAAEVAKRSILIQEAERRGRESTESDRRQIVDALRQASDASEREQAALAREAALKEALARRADLDAVAVEEAVASAVSDAHRERDRREAQVLGERDARTQTLEADLAAARRTIATQRDALDMQRDSTSEALRIREDDMRRTAEEERLRRDAAVAEAVAAERRSHAEEVQRASREARRGASDDQAEAVRRAVTEALDAERARREATVEAAVALERQNSERAVAEALRLRDAEVARERALKDAAVQDAHMARSLADEARSSPVDATSAFASAAAQRASRRSGGRREPNTPLSRGMSEPERGV